METLTKEQEIEMIASRITLEYGKHSTLEWHKIAASKIHSKWKEYWTADRDKRILELTEQMNLLRMDSRDTIDTQNVIIFDQTNRIKELEKEVHRLQFSI